METRNLMDMALYVHAYTAKAVLVSEDNAKGSAHIWLPLSQIEIDLEKDNWVKITLANITMPEWLAKEKELI